MEDPEFPLLIPHQEAVFQPEFTGRLFGLSFAGQQREGQQNPVCLQEIQAKRNEPVWITRRDRGTVKRNKGNVAVEQTIVYRALNPLWL